MNYKKLVISLLLPHMAGIAGAFFTIPSVYIWYEGLVKPAFSPPNWIFGPVWFILYTLMGFSVYIIWESVYEYKNAREAVFLFWVHLLFNAMWTVLFFNLKDIALAFFDIMIIWVMIAVLMSRFYKISKTAAYLLVPYFVWVSYASMLNLFIWAMN
jgi:tryptophan-rich sensory protein